MVRRLYSLRAAVAFLIGALVFQWLCHVLTAFAMSAWMAKAQGGPTAQILDSVFAYACIGVATVLSLVAGFGGVLILRRTEPTALEVRSAK